MSEKEPKGELTKHGETVPKKVDLGPSASMDLSFLSDDERKELLLSHAKGMLDITKKAQELQVESVVLKKTLDDLADATHDVSEKGNAVTLSHTQTTKLGRTEVMMGNTQQAQSGKFSKSQTGEKDWTPFYIIGGVVAVIIIIAIVFN